MKNVSKNKNSLNSNKKNCNNKPQEMKSKNSTTKKDTNKQNYNYLINTDYMQKEQYKINNLNSLELLDENNSIDINADLINKQKQLKELEKQIKKSTKNKPINNNNTNTISKNKASIEISNNTSNNEELNNLIRETKQEILLNQVNIGINNNKEKKYNENLFRQFKK